MISKLIRSIVGFSHGSKFGEIQLEVGTKFLNLAELKKDTFILHN